MKKAKFISVALAMILIVSSLFMSGCGESVKEMSTDVYYGTYTTDVTILKPFYLPDTTGKKIIANCIDGLIETDNYGKYVPSLAESWSHNEDYSVWTFNLRQGAKWVDYTGKEVAEVTAQDFVDGLRYVADPQNTKADISLVKTIVSGLSEYIDGLKACDEADSGREQMEASFDSTVGVKALSKYVVEYTLTKSVSYFESFLVTEIFLPNYKQFSDEKGIAFGTSNESILYCGAYYLKKWQRNKEFILEKNPLYYDIDKISVNTIILQKVTDPAVTIEMFKRGELTGTSLSGDQVAHYINDELWGKYITLKEKSSVNYWFFNNFESKNSEWNSFINNEDFRKAIYHALDRVILAELYNPYGAEQMLINTICPSEVCFDENGKDYTDYLADIKSLGADTYNPTLALEYFNKALAALTDGNGNISGAKAENVKMGNIASFETDGKLPVQFVYVHGASTDEVQMAQLIKANFEEIFGKENVEVILAQYSNDKFTTVISPGYYDFCYDNYSFKYGDPMAQLSRLMTGAEVNDGKYSLAEFDELVTLADSKTVMSERYALFAQAEALLIEGGYIIPWESGGGTYGMSREIPFTAPRGGFGLSRFKYKGVQLQSLPVTAEQYEQLEQEFLQNLNK